jgi:uncharacterized membrane protein
MTRGLALAALLASGCFDTTQLTDFPCPPAGTALTYAGFGRAFLASNCETCHAADAPSRHGAPTAFTFDTLDQVRAHADRIFVRAAADNTTMPPGPVDPPADERAQLAEWLACGAP